MKKDENRIKEIFHQFVYFPFFTVVGAFGFDFISFPCACHLSSENWIIFFPSLICTDHELNLVLTANIRQRLFSLPTHETFSRR
jgi:hypothetical protein